MIERRLMDELERVAWRYRWLRLFQTLAAGWLGVAAVGLAVLWATWDDGHPWPWVPTALGVACVVAAVASVWLSLSTARDPRQLARWIEARHPELNSLLLTAVEQQPDPDASPKRFGYLQETVIREALDHCIRHDWEGAVSPRKLRWFQAAAAAALGLVVVVTALLAVEVKEAAAHPVPPRTPPPAPDAPFRTTVKPGDVEVERGTSLVVTARFDGRVPDDAELVHFGSSGQAVRAPMSLSLSDPMFGGRVADVQSDLVYRVEFAGQATRDYNVTVFEHPRLERADVRLEYPEYTHLEEKLIEDTRRVTAVEGTRLTLICRLNKPVERARLVPDDGEPIELAPEADNPAVWTAAHMLRQSGSYRLKLLDAAGRANKEPPEFVFRATPNLPPDVKITFPGRDVRVSPIEELATAASVWDDFGLSSYGINYGLAGQTPVDLVLGGATGRNERRKVDHVIEVEKLHAEPDQLLSYYLWAEDVGPDGNPRRTLGDMYFAEVRHFEEIFREGQQPTSSQQQQQQQQEQGENAQQAEQLAEAQKQIINATWKVIRRETGPQPTDAFAGDVGEIQKAQEDALQKLGELVEKLNDAESQEHAAAVAGHMQAALTHLGEATQATSPKPLTPALSAEQAAYQGLLKLRAREHEVTRSRQQSRQQSSSASSSQSRARQQLEQLELKESENRYETERQASPQEEQQDRENRQVYNRLRELARRQSDLNQRMKELQSALEEAKTEKEREELAEQLKRLREQQREMLDDTDELANRMDRPENQERMSESRQQLGETRENVRQASEALEEGQLSQAVTSGTRAERELGEMREEFRRQTSRQFSEEARQLRDDARKLAENEAQLRERLGEFGGQEPSSGRLRDPEPPEQLGDAFRRQEEDLSRLLEDVRQTVEEAEEAEPLMTRHLYDSLRQARQEKVEDALKATGELVDRGILDQASAAERQAGEGIENLKQGIEEAAESVLGDQQEALRKALSTLDDLSRELNEEMRQADPNAQRQPQPSEQAAGQERQPDQGRLTRPGQQRSQQPGEPRPQETDQQASQPGGRQPGQQQEQTGQQPQPADRQQASTQPGQQQRSQQPGQQQQASQQPGQQQASQRDGQQTSPGQQSLQRFLTAKEAAQGPIAGNDFLDWSDRLRDVEEMVNDAQMRAEAARIRDAARSVRLQARGGRQAPKWDLVRQLVAEPLAELRDRVAEELLRQSDKPLVPIDRDPVPSKYTEQVRRYYEELGGGQ